VGFDELGELHLHYVKGLPSPYCMASADHDRFVQEHLPLEPITEDDYHRGVEEFAGRCCCGARFTFDAPPRCPKCRSTRLGEGDGPLILYD
jgi:hypothetical protein